MTRSTIALTRRGSGNTVPHSLKGRLVAIEIDARSWRSVVQSSATPGRRSRRWTSSVSVRDVGAQSSSRSLECHEPPQFVRPGIVLDDPQPAVGRQLRDLVVSEPKHRVRHGRVLKGIEHSAAFVDR